VTYPRSWSRKTRAKKIHVKSRSLKTRGSRGLLPASHGVSPYAPHTLASTAVAIRRAAEQGQVRGHLANPRPPLSHLPTIPHLTQHPNASAKAAADSSAASLGCSVVVAASVAAIPAGRRSGRRARSRICEPYDALRIQTAKTTPLLSPRHEGSSVGGPCVSLQRLHPLQHRRNSENAKHGTRKKIRIKAGSAIAPRLEVGMRVRHLLNNVPL
jgi:hypothetical protein